MRWILFIAAVSLTGCLGTSSAPAPIHHYGVKGGAGLNGMHSIESGDTLWSIAQRYELSMRDVITVNQLSPPYRLTSGMRIKLPPPNTYRVREGDSLYLISRTFDVSQTELARLNRLSSPYVIAPGQTLKIPGYAKEQPQKAVYRAPEMPQTKSASKPQPKVQNAVLTPRTKIPDPPPRSGNGKFLRPVSGRVISGYGPKAGGLHNDGINIRAAKGTPVQAAEDGVVVYAGNGLKGYGNLVLVRHADRWITAYGHLDRIKVTRGQTLKRGVALGTVGASGNVSEPQLHFEIRRGTSAVNPEGFL